MGDQVQFQTYSDELTTIASAEECGFDRWGYDFNGWNLEPSGSSTEYQPGQQVRFGQDTTLYAQWLRKTVMLNAYPRVPGSAYPTYHKTYNWYWGEGGVLKLSDMEGINVSPTGYIFKGWCDNESGQGTLIPDGTTLPLTTDVVNMYGQWRPIQYTIRYNFNTGLAYGTTNSSTHAYNVPQNLTRNGYSRQVYILCDGNGGYINGQSEYRFGNTTCSFLKWTATIGGQTREFSDGQPVVNLTTVDNDTINLYACWGNTITHVFLPTIGQTTGPTGQHLNGWKTQTGTYIRATYMSQHQGQGQGYSFDDVQPSSSEYRIYAQWENDYGAHFAYNVFKGTNGLYTTVKNSNNEDVNMPLDFAHLSEYHWNYKAHNGIVASWYAINGAMIWNADERGEDCDTFSFNIARGSASPWGSYAVYVVNLVTGTVEHITSGTISSMGTTISVSGSIPTGWKKFAIIPSITNSIGAIFNYNSTNHEFTLTNNNQGMDGNVRSLYGSGLTWTVKA